MYRGGSSSFGQMDDHDVAVEVLRLIDQCLHDHFGDLTVKLLFCHFFLDNLICNKHEANIGIRKLTLFRARNISTDDRMRFNKF